MLQPLRLQYAALFTPVDTGTMRPFFAQQDHMQVVTFVLDSLPETLALYVLLYAIRLVGWQKHCNLSTACHTQFQTRQILRERLITW